MRETKNIKVGEHNVVVKTYITAREAQAIQSSAFAGLKVEVVGDQPKISDFNPAVQVQVEKTMVEQVVVSVDGKAEGVADIVLDEWRNEEYIDLIAQLNDIVSKKKTE